MLDLAPAVAVAVKSREAAAHAAAVEANTMLDAVTTGADASSRVAAHVVRALVAAEIIDAADTGDAISALVDARLLPPVTTRRTRA